MQAPQPREFGIFKPRDRAENTDLFGMFQLGLETDDIPQRAVLIVLTQLNHGVRPAPGAWIVEADGLHRPEP